MPVEKSEINASIALLKYCGGKKTIVDVGANKGVYSKELIHHLNHAESEDSYRCLLIEPVPQLANYCRVEFAGNKNVEVVEVAMSINCSDNETFYQYGNENHELSSFYKHPQWEGLDHNLTTVEVSAKNIGWLCKQYGIEKIDLLKIDVEGGDADVFLGCSELLQEKKIDFIQIEYGGLYRTAGYTFANVLSFAAQFGYQCYSWKDDERCFVKVQSFVEDYHAENYYFTHRHIDYKLYTAFWNTEFKKNVKGLPRVHMALEIGCFEGITTNYILDNLILEGGGWVVCVDPLWDKYTDYASKELNDAFSGQFYKFVHNTVGRNVELIQMTSEKAFPHLQGRKFGFAYIDGDHSEEAVYHDAINALPLVESGGHVLFDDYGYSDGTAKGIDRFLSEKADEIIVLKKEYQVLIQKK